MLSLEKTKSSRRVAFGGIISALSLLCMFLSGVFPFAEYTCPAAAGILLIALVIDFGKRTALVAYISIGLLSLIITPNKESAMLFLFLFGYYPILKSVFERFRSRIGEWALKIGVFNVTILAAYWVIINLFGLTEVLENLSVGGVQIAAQYSILILLALGNVVFVIYDLALTRLIQSYCHLLRPKLKRLIP